MIEEWIAYLKNRRIELKDFLVTQLNVDSQELDKKNIKTVFSSKLQAKTLKTLRMACIMDRFTLDSYKPECNLLELTPGEWKKQIDEFEPELIFVESAWQGKDGLWYRKIANGSPELYQMTNYAQGKEIPIIFWNKEDPVYTDTFMPAARCADYVFTTDIDCVKKYKNSLGHDNVFFLHFAAQPAVHNPLEKYERKDKFCFAGAYYHRYPNRAKTFDAFSDIFLKTKGMDIYDRNYENPRPEFVFPERYNNYILGCLDTSQIDVAYKGYNYGINMNSVEQSQTMFARRVFEMLASNTITVGNYSRGVKNLFGDLTICTNDIVTLETDLNSKCVDETDYRKYRLLGLRKVLQHHLYEDRLNYIVKKVFGIEIKRELPTVSFISSPTKEKLGYVLENFHRQVYEKKRLILVGDFEKIDDPNVVVISEAKAKDKKVSDYISEGYIGIVSEENFYGANYLTDLVLTLRYLDVSGMGKGAYYRYDGEKVHLSHKYDVYKYVPCLKKDRSIVKRDLYKEVSIEQFCLNSYVENDDLLAVDEFNFCENYNGDSCSYVEDMMLCDQGIPLEEIEKFAERIKKDIWDSKIQRIPKEDIGKQCKVPGSGELVSELTDKGWKLISNLEEKKSQYIYFKDFYEVEKYQRNKNLNIQYIGNGDLDLVGVCIFYDIEKNKINPIFPKLNILSVNDVPENAKYFRLGFRICGSGTSEIKEICLGLEHNMNSLTCFLSRSNVLVLSNNYPSPNSLYRNMFVHKRVMSYKESRLVCDVMRMNIFCKNNFEEFEGINIVEGQADRLGNILEESNIDTVCVHFLDKNMWNILKNFNKKIRIIVWLHGADIQPWWRRKHNYTTEEELNKAKEESEERQAFWKSVFEEIDKFNIHFIFVSQYFADIVFEDYKITLPRNRYSVIHNCIDTNMFKYVKKDSEQRKKLLSIRPYASRKYGNDLTVRAIQELSKEQFFKELKFLIIGDGKLFDETLEPIRKYKNVEISKKFLRQSEIAELYQEYGIALIPTREDTQGVSRDEAMASGLVPVTNAVTAIPEFVDDSCGILAPDEDYLEMAKGIKALYYDSDMFLRMSEKAAQRVREQSTKEYTIDKEIDIICNSLSAD